MATGELKSVNFEVFGKVQGVFFRKYTEIQAKKLGLSGWVKNTSSGTVVGVIEGPGDKIAMMEMPGQRAELKKWLEKKGSPKSVIMKCVFKDEKTIHSTSFPSFSVEREMK